MTVLRAGVALADITPPYGVPHGLWRLRTGLAAGRREPLLVQALVFDDGQRIAAIVAVDLAFVSRDLTEAVRARVEALTGIPPEAVLVNAAHNHSAPSLPRSVTGVRPDHLGQFARYEAALPDLIAGTVYSAHYHRRPARIGAATTRAPGLTSNRVRHELPVDDTLSVLRVETEDGRVLAVAAAFACHPITLAGHTLLWNAEFPGPFRHKVESSYPGATCLFLQGCAGDIGPWNYWFGNDDALQQTYEHRDRLGVALADHLLGTFSTIETSGDHRVACGTQRLALRRRRLAWPDADVLGARKALRRTDGTRLP